MACFEFVSLIVVGLIQFVWTMGYSLDILCDVHNISLRFLETAAKCGGDHLKLPSRHRNSLA
jgi:hypothetical protein